MGRNAKTIGGTTRVRSRNDLQPSIASRSCSAASMRGLICRSKRDCALRAVLPILARSTPAQVDVSCRTTGLERRLSDQPRYLARCSPSPLVPSR